MCRDLSKTGNDNHGALGLLKAIKGDYNYYESAPRDLEVPVDVDKLSDESEWRVRRPCVVRALCVRASVRSRISDHQSVCGDRYTFYGITPKAQPSTPKEEQYADIR